MSKNLKEALTQNVSDDAILMTDSSPLHKTPGKRFEVHSAVDRTAHEYVRSVTYTNTVEGYFSQLKRGIDGTHHHVSAYHLGRYVGEFGFRYNSRKLNDSKRTKLAIEQTKGKRLQCREPVEGVDTSRNT